MLKKTKAEDEAVESPVEENTAPASEEEIDKSIEALVVN